MFANSGVSAVALFWRLAAPLHVRRYCCPYARCHAPARCPRSTLASPRPWRGPPRPPTQVDHFGPVAVQPSQLSAVPAEHPRPFIPASRAGRRPGRRRRISTSSSSSARTAMSFRCPVSRPALRGRTSSQASLRPWPRQRNRPGEQAVSGPMGRLRRGDRIQPPGIQSPGAGSHVRCCRPSPMSNPAHSRTSTLAAADIGASWRHERPVTVN